jgi:hypothetical protein
LLVRGETMVFIWSIHFEECSPGVIVNCEFVFFELLGTISFLNC